MNIVNQTKKLQLLESGKDSVHNPYDVCGPYGASSCILVENMRGGWGNLSRFIRNKSKLYRLTNSSHKFVFCNTSNFSKFPINQIKNKSKLKGEICNLDKKKNYLKIETQHMKLLSIYFFIFKINLKTFMKLKQLWKIL